MARRLERSMSGTPAEKADESSGNDDDREGYAEEENPDEGGCSERQHDIGLERAFANSYNRLQHNREHRSLEPEEQRRDDADLTEQDVDVAECHDGDHAGQ